MQNCLVVFSYFYCKYLRSSLIFNLSIMYVGNQIIQMACSSYIILHSEDGSEIELKHCTFSFSTNFKKHWSIAVSE